MFSTTLHHNISIQKQKLRNGIESYRDMITYIFGQRQQDIKFARKALDNYRINPSVHLYVMEYNRNDPATTIIPYTDLFGWHKNPSTTRRKDIRTPTVKWMHLMYQIGATLLQACVILPPADNKVNAQHFMKFNLHLALFQLVGVGVELKNGVKF